MIVHFRIESLKQNHWYEHAVRFVLGGLMTVLAGIVADNFGPAIGGLFLAFPAIFCASTTLIEKHERQRKQEKGLRGEVRGQQAAALDSAGAAWGSIGLAAFGLCVWWLAPKSPVVTLCVAFIAWFLIAVLMWRLRSKLRSAREKPKR